MEFGFFPQNARTAEDYEVLLPAEVVEKAHLLKHFIPDFCLHRFSQDNT
jgi:hypothetical protein